MNGSNYNEQRFILNPGMVELAGDAGLEPTLTESKSVVLPIRRIPNIKLGANYLCPEAGFEPASFAFRANILTF